MKRFFGRLSTVLIAGLVLGMTSCAIGPDLHARKFHEEQLADLVIRYSAEQAIFRLKPEARDGVFQHIYDREQLCAEAAELPGQRYMAVVVIDYIYSAQVERELIDSWVDSFKPLNYERIVFLRSNGSDSISGLRVVAEYDARPHLSGGFANR